MSKSIYSIPKNHYIYLLVDQNHKKYGGVRTCEGSPENDDYMGSSKYVCEAIKNGVVFTKHIIKTFDTRDEANEYEEKWLKRVNAGYNNNWYNKSNGDMEFCQYGKKYSIEQKLKKSIDMKGKNKGENSFWFGKKGKEHPKFGKSPLLGRKHHKETIKKMSGCKIGNKNPFFGKTHTEENKRKFVRNIPVSIDGIDYPSKKEASISLKISLYKINQLLKNR